jgi:peptidyl-prolyl cis-trans isomerase SurA
MKNVITFKAFFLYYSKQCLVLLTLLLASSHSALAAEMLDQVAAIVDDDVVMESELLDRINQIQLQIKSQGRPLPPDNEMRQQILNQMIVENLQLQMARRAGVRISDAQLNQAMTRVAAQNNLGLDEFREMLKQQGISYTATREQIRNEMIIQQVQAGNINNRVEITDQEVDNFLKSTEGQQQTAPQYRISHLLLSIDTVAMQSDEEPQLEEFERAREQIEAGTPLLEWLEQYRKSGGREIQGGDLGWRKDGELPAVFAEFVPSLAVGQVAGPIRSAAGMHLVQLMDRRGGPQIIDQTLARHILVKPSEIRTDEQCQQLLLDLRRQVLAGEDFDDLARQYSEDFGSAQEGGELGWSRPGQFVPAFEETMNGLAIGEISQPFESQFGWHILQVEERRKYDISQENAREQARRYLYQRKFDDELDAWLQKIRDEAYVDIKNV